jgi:hypothetical protein
MLLLKQGRKALDEPRIGIIVVISSLVHCFILAAIMLVYRKNDMLSLPQKNKLPFISVKRSHRNPALVYASSVPSRMDTDSARIEKKIPTKKIVSHGSGVNKIKKGKQAQKKNFKKRDFAIKEKSKIIKKENKKNSTLERRELEIQSVIKQDQVPLNSPTSLSPRGMETPQAVCAVEPCPGTGGAIESASSAGGIIAGLEEIAAEDRIVMAIREAVQVHWRPPRGFHQEIVCVIEFYVNDYGRASDVIMIEKSCYTSYNFALRDAVLRAVYPPQARNKRIRLEW